MCFQKSPFPAPVPRGVPAGRPETGELAFGDHKCLGVRMGASPSIVIPA